MQLKQRAAFRDAFGGVEAVHAGGDAGVLRPGGHNHRGGQSDTARQKTHPGAPSCFCWGSIQRGATETTETTRRKAYIRLASPRSVAPRCSKTRTNVRSPKIRLFSFSNL